MTGCDQDDLGKLSPFLFGRADQDRKDFFIAGNQPSCPKLSRPDPDFIRSFATLPIPNNRQANSSGSGATSTLGDKA
jgi:hypothetical protein